MECYCTCILEILRYFFNLQSLTTSKMRKFQILKLSQFQKAKTCWTENWWSSGIMSNFLGEFFMFWGSQKNLKPLLRSTQSLILGPDICSALYFWSATVNHFIGVVTSQEFFSFSSLLDSPLL